MIKSITMQDAVNFLNQLLDIDRVAISKVFLTTRIPCNEALSKHPTVQVRSFLDVQPEPLHQVGPLGILNGMFGYIRDQATPGCIAAEIDPINSKILKFILLLQQESINE